MTLLGRTVGSIRIVDLIGKGGMGDVYVGYDERLKRKVALKALRSDYRMDANAKARFLREAQILSQLEHPNICRIYDLIEGEEEDFLVLELIKGRSLRKAIRDGLDASFRMRIARQVTGVIKAAHEKGIIHRDLKPDNVMVTDEGEAKVLDFGLSRSLGAELLPSTTFMEQDTASGAEEMLSPHERVPATGEPVTRAGTIVGTLGYMSPEQARGDPATTSSDIYSLGLVLQELFSGHPPYQRGRTPQELYQDGLQGLTRPVTGIDPDLTALINRMKSLAPAARPSATDVADWLDRVADKPRLRRRRILVSSAVVILALFAVIMTVQAIRIGREADRANGEAKAAREVSDFLVNLFKVSDPGEARGNSVTAREILDAGAQKIGQDLRDQPLMQARLMNTMGKVYRELGLNSPSAALLEKSLAARKARLGPGDPLVAESMSELALCYMDMGRFKESEGLYREALGIQEGALGKESVEVAQTLNNMAGLYWAQNNLPEAERLCTRALEIREKVLGPAHPEVANTVTNLAILYSLQGKSDRAEELFWRALSIREKTGGADHPDTVTTLTSLATLYAEQGKYDRAEPLFRRALSVSEKTLGPEHPNVATCLSNLGDLCRLQGKPAEAVPYYQRALPIWDKALGPSHPDTAYALSGLGGAYSDLGRYDEALPLYQKALGIREKALGVNHPEVLQTLGEYAACLRKAGREAEASNVESLARSRKDAAGEKAP